MRKKVTIEGNEAAAYVAYRLNEVIVIYPITPSSTMGELADEWATKGIKNIWGTVPFVQEMQSEGGAAGAVHGALQTGALSTTFTASQGLLLMIPNMYKIAGELTPVVFHVAARSVATHALSIFGDHSDVMAARATGFGFLCSSSVQEVMDFACISHAIAFESRVPFVHFFDGFRTSHEVNKIELLTDEDIRAMVNEQHIIDHRNRRLTPENPVIRGTAQNPDVFFQSREAINPFYNACPDIAQKAMDDFAKLTGRQYKLFDYYGALDAQRVIVMMGSGADACRETVDYLVSQGEKVGLLIVRLYRPFANEHFVAALPKTLKSLAVLDRTKEPGSGGEPLYLDVVNAVFEAAQQKKLAAIPGIIGGRYGLSSKEFTPAMVKAVYDELKKESPKNHFTIGIEDDLGHTSLSYDQDFSTENTQGVRAVFYGLGADGTVSANKNSIKIIGENTLNFAQGYFVYDSKKSGSLTISHLRFGPQPIRSSYLITKASFVACHQFNFLFQYDVLKYAQPKAVFLLNTHYGPQEVWAQLPESVQKEIIAKQLRFFVIDGYKVAQEAGMGGLINTIMQTCFFAISDILSKDEAIASIKTYIKKTYEKKGEEVVQMNFAAVDSTLLQLHQVDVPAVVSSKIALQPAIAAGAPEFVNRVTSRIVSHCGNSIPVSQFPVDGTFPVGTSKWEKRNIATEIPVWEKDLCIQCGKCVAVCPHAVIRAKMFEPSQIAKLPMTFKHVAAKDLPGSQFVLQVSPADCTGCGLCVDVCPVKSKTEVKVKALNMRAIAPLLEAESFNWDFFEKMPEVDRSKIKKASIRGAQYLQPLFEFSGACAGCGETPYIKLVTQLFGDRMMVANATGCSSIYGGNLPTTPWTKNAQGRGPAWANSLFEDNAEFGLGFRLTVDKQKQFAGELLKDLSATVGTQLAEQILNASQADEAEIYEQTARVEELKKKLASIKTVAAQHLLSIADMLIKKSIWIIGGDGWAYDIGFGGLDHVISSGRNVNILVLDTEVYSNTGGQMSKSTPRAAVAKFAAGGKMYGKKDLPRMAMTYGHVYVATVALGAKDEHTIKVLMEAENYDGPSLVIAYSHCIAHGINMTGGLQEHKAAVQSGHWPLFRYNPMLALEGKNPLILDSGEPQMKFKEYAYRQNRFKILTKTNPEEAQRLMVLAQDDVDKRWAIYKDMAAEPASQPQKDTKV